MAKQYRFLWDDVILTGYWRAEKIAGRKKSLVKHDTCDMNSPIIQWLEVNIVELGEIMSRNNLQRYIITAASFASNNFKSLTSRPHFKKLYRYLNNDKMLVNLL